MMTYLEMIGVWQLILILIILIEIIPTIIALVDILKSEFKGNNKIVWILVVLLANFFGNVLYFLIGREQKINKNPSR
ncbi:PLD nuclease N-terminal domain-containing protein [Tenacibaculum discolor]|uniref:PLD nuclease N-terminal domain-containing protein n=1 Tax=Tenacibaculum discolor TaxID=361581 RepID=UPI000F0DED90|nr:PLD nuclease N-terminal domain-containing protein [Tenacibaculum discolor]RLK03173.1 phospholipase D-like protein [Tenacibaculum discolor]